MPTFVDSHSHLADPAFDADREAVIDRARVTGAAALICIGESLDAARRSREIAARYPGFIWHTAGVHPFDAAAFDPARDPDLIRAEVAQGAVGIGECGLDNSYDNSTPEQQRRAFAAQLALGKELGRPVIVHTRQAVDETAAMVREAGQEGITGILHCFTGPASLAEVGIEAGWYISFSGVITFKKWTDDALLRIPPANRLLVESDAPYLAPVPNRGKRNEPAWVSQTVAKLAEARGLSADRLGDVVTENAVKCFNLPLNTT